MENLIAVIISTWSRWHLPEEIASIFLGIVNSSSLMGISHALRSIHPAETLDIPQMNTHWRVTSINQLSRFPFGNAVFGSTSESFLSESYW